MRLHAQKMSCMSIEQPSTEENIEAKFKDSKARDQEGNLLKVYHFSDDVIKNFSLDHVGKNFQGDEGFFGAGIYFTEDENSFYYGRNRYAAYLNVRNPFIIRNPSVEDVHNLHGRRQELLNQGYDGVMVWNDAIPDEEKIIFGRPQVVKGRKAGWNEICVFKSEDVFVVETEVKKG